MARRVLHGGLFFCMGGENYIESLSRDQLKPRKKVIARITFFLGAGGENRTLITCLEGTYISHYTTPA